MKKSDLITWSEVQLLAGCIYGEARSEPWAGKMGVGLTVRNRVLNPGFWNWGKNWREVLLRSRQFSCFNPGNPNLPRMVKAKKRNDLLWQKCMMIAEKIYLGHIEDFVGADHYHRIDCYPQWRHKLEYLLTIGDHKFYRVKEKSNVR